MSEIQNGENISYLNKQGNRYSHNLFPHQYNKKSKDKKQYNEGSDFYMETNKLLFCLP